MAAAGTVEGITLEVVQAFQQQPGGSAALAAALGRLAQAASDAATLPDACASEELTKCLCSSLRSGQTDVQDEAAAALAALSSHDGAAAALNKADAATHVCNHLIRLYFGAYTCKLRLKLADIARTNEIACAAMVSMRDRCSSLTSIHPIECLSQAVGQLRELSTSGVIGTEDSTASAQGRLLRAIGNLANDAGVQMRVVGGSGAVPAAVRLLASTSAAAAAPGAPAAPQVAAAVAAARDALFALSQLLHSSAAAQQQADGAGLVPALLPLLAATSPVAQQRGRAASGSSGPAPSSAPAASATADETQLLVLDVLANAVLQNAGAQKQLAALGGVSVLLQHLCSAQVRRWRCPALMFAASQPFKLEVGQGNLVCLHLPPTSGGLSVQRAVSIACMAEAWIPLPCFLLPRYRRLPPPTGASS